MGIKYKGLPYPKEFTIIQKYKFGKAVHKVLIKAYDNILLSGYFLISMFIGELSLSNAAGPLVIWY